VLQGSVTSVDAVFASGLTNSCAVDNLRAAPRGFGFSLMKMACIGDSRAGDVADRFRGLSCCVLPIILMGAGDAGGNNEYLLTAGDEVEVLRANSGLGNLGSVMRLAGSSSPPASSTIFKGIALPSDSDWLLFRLPSVDDFKLSRVLLRRASSEDDVEAAGIFWNITVYLSSGGFGMLISSLGSGGNGAGCSTDFLVSSMIFGDERGVGSNSIVLPSLLDFRLFDLSLKVSSSRGIGGGYLVGCSGTCVLCLNQWCFGSDSSLLLASCCWLIDGLDAADDSVALVTACLTLNKAPIFFHALGCRRRCFSGNGP
jgi:hypothetical protein